MNKLLIPKQTHRKLESIYEHDLQDGNKCYSVHIKNIEDTIWCNSIEDVYNLLSTI